MEGEAGRQRRQDGSQVANCGSWEVALRFLCQAFGFCSNRAFPLCISSLFFFSFQGTYVMCLVHSNKRVVFCFYLICFQMTGPENTS